MSGVQPDSDLFARYLQVLGVSRRAPSLDGLAELTAAHLTRIPFENVSKLYYSRRQAPPHRPPELSRYLDGIEQHHFGGTCYANAYNFHLLLAHLGYEVSLCGADMAAPDVHLVNTVRLDRRDYLVDVGYAAPFFAPLPLDAAGDQEVAWGRDRYVLKPRDASGRSRLEHHRDGALHHGYVANPSSRRIEEFAKVIAASFADSATFMHALLIARFWPTRSLTLRNLTLIEVERARYRMRHIPDRTHLADAIEQHFLIPRHITRAALDGVELTQQT